MSTELPKNYDPSAIEASVYQAWLTEKCFAADPAAAGEPYSIVIPPPNVTGALHLGHAINNTLQDILTRKARMEGKNALWIPGLDHAGIATQAVVEKTIKEKEGKDRYSLAETKEKSREELIRRIWEWKQQYGDRILSQLQRMGCSCDWDRTRFTLDEMCAKAVRETFFKLFKDGLVYRGKRLVNWDTHLQTSISDDEIYHETVKTNLWHIKYEIVDSGRMGYQPMPSDAPKHGLVAHATATHMTVATTRPETLLGDTAVAVHSEDPRWNWAIGKSVRLPLLGRLIPIIADDILVDPKFGSGVVKVTPAHDPNDYAVWQRHQGQPDQIDIINLLNPDGTLNDAAGPYKGLYVTKARTKVIEDLEAAGLMAKIEPYETQVGHSDRSKTPIQPYLSDQWFVKMAPLAEPALQVVRDGTIQFFPERHAQQYLSWLGEKRDWPISRQLWWGHRIPVWSNRDIEKAADAHDKFDRGNSFGIVMEGTFHECFRTVPTDEQRILLIESGFVEDPDVLDTWFSSALWPFSTLGWPEKTDALAKWYPTSVLLTGRDIITLWVARMVMMGMYNLGNAEFRMLNAEKNAGAVSTSPPLSEFRIQNSEFKGIPFHHVAINPTILDGKGERMSKSKGNGVDPVDIIDTHGADALRFTLATMATETQDVRMPVKKDAQGRNTSDKFDMGRNFCNKLWNAARFVLQNLTTENTEKSQSNTEKGKETGTHSASRSVSSSVSSVPSVVNSLADRWIISRFNQTVADANHAISTYRFDLYAKACYDFFWRDFCDWYVESVKSTLKTDAGAASREVATAMLDGALRLMHPVIPFITETIWSKLNEAAPRRPLCGRVELRLCKSQWPAGGPIDQDVEQTFAGLQAVIGTIRNMRSEHKVDLKKLVTVSIAPPDAKAMQAAQDNRGLIESLATSTITQITVALQPPTGAVRATANGYDIYVEGLSDPAAEQQRQSKRKEELTKQRAALKGRLDNAAYVAKAPPKLVEESKAQLAAIEAELVAIEAELAKLDSK